MMRLFLHLLPLVPLFYQRYIFFVAALLLVALMYIKRNKIEKQKELHLKSLQDPSKSDKYIEDFDSRIKLFKKLTYDVPFLRLTPKD